MYTIYSYHNVQALAGVLNAIAGILGAQDFKSSLALVVMFGFIAAVLAYALAPQKLQGWQWIASVVLVYTVLFLPKERVQIIDVTGQDAPVVVQNVPFGLAGLASATSSVGHTLTGLFETAMQTLPDADHALPQELSYSNNGLVFGARLVGMTQAVPVPDPAFRADLVNFIVNCIQPDLASNQLPARDFAVSTNLWAMFGTTNPARFSTVTTTNGPDVRPCPEVYFALRQRMGDVTRQMQEKLAYQAHPVLLRSEAITRIQNEVPAAFARAALIQAGQTTANVLEQVAVISAINDASLIEGQRFNDPAGLTLAFGRASALVQTNSAFVNNAKIAEQALPVVRNVIEAVAYAMFPLVLLLLMLASGMEAAIGLKNYGLLLGWIQFWPPLYAVLNFLATIYVSHDIAASAAYQGGSGLTLSTNGAISASALSCQAVVGWLTLSVPFIAWVIVKRMENLGTTLAGALTPLQSAVATQTGSAALGNLSLGNTSMHQVQGMPVSTTPFNRSQQDAGTGATVFTNGNGIQYVDLKRNSGPVQELLRTTEGTLFARRSSVQASEAHTKLQSAELDESAAFAKLVAYQSSVKRDDSGASSRAQGLTSDALKKVDIVTGWQERKLAEEGVALTEDTSLAFELGTKGLPIPVVGANARQGWTDAQRKAYAAGEQAIHDRMYAEYAGAREAITNNAVQSATNTTSHGHTDSVTAQLGQAALARSAASAAYADARSAERSAQAQVGKGRDIVADVTGLDGEEFAKFNGMAGHAFGSVAEYDAAIDKILASSKADMVKLWSNWAAEQTVPTPVLTGFDGRQFNGTVQELKEGAAAPGVPDSIESGQRGLVVGEHVEAVRKAGQFERTDRSAHPGDRIDPKAAVPQVGGVTPPGFDPQKREATVERNRTITALGHAVEAMADGGVARTNKALSDSDHRSLLGRDINPAAMTKELTIGQVKDLAKWTANKMHENGLQTPAAFEQNVNAAMDYFMANPNMPAHDAIKAFMAGKRKNSAASDFDPSDPKHRHDASGAPSKR